MNLLQRIAGAALVLSTVGLTGCGDKLATVNGTVTYKGKPVTSGSLTFYINGNAVASSSVLPDGKFVTEGVPYGEVTITVTGGKADIMKGPGQGRGPMSPTAPKAAKKDGANTPRPESAIPEPESSPETPEKYRNAATSPLKFNIDSSSKTITLSLE